MALVVFFALHFQNARASRGETIRDPRELGPALRGGLAQTRSGRPAVIAVWLPRLLHRDYRAPNAALYAR